MRGRAELAAISPEVAAARKTATEIVKREPKDLREWQANMRELVSALDNYDRLLDRDRRTMQRGDQENLYASDPERGQIRVLLEVLDLRKQQSAKQREEANLILAYDPSISNVSDLQSELRLTDSDVEGLDRRASELLADSGIK